MKFCQCGYFEQAEARRQLLGKSTLFRFWDSGLVVIGRITGTAMLPDHHPMLNRRHLVFLIDEGVWINIHAVSSMQEAPQVSGA